MSNDETTNRAYVRGKINSTPVFSHEVFGEQFFEFTALSPRLSGQTDEIPITISERIMNEYDFSIGTEMTFFGQFRSYNKMIDGRSKLILTLFVREIFENDYNMNPNVVMISGFVCKPCIYRQTPFDREIADILIAVNRSYNKSDYIPCIAWGRNARFSKFFSVGDSIAIIGRIQSRKYVKKINETIVEEKTAFEISVNKIATEDNINKMIDENEKFFTSDNESNPFHIQDNLSEVIDNIS